MSARASGLRSLLARHLAVLTLVQALVAALRAAAARRVRVRVVVDGFGSKASLAWLQALLGGQLLSPDSLARAAALGLNPAWRLADNDGFGVFEALDDLVVTGPTRTNVNDFRAILIDAPPSSEHFA